MRTSKKNWNESTESNLFAEERISILENHAKDNDQKISYIMDTISGISDALGNISNLINSTVLMNVSLSSLLSDMTIKFTSERERVNRIIDGMNFLDQKISAMAMTIAKNSDMEPEDFQRELDGLRKDAESIGKTIDFLIESTNKYNKNNKNEEN